MGLDGTNPPQQSPHTERCIHGRKGCLSKGVGEGAMVAVAPAIANAVYNAVGVRIKDLPLCPERVLRLIEEKRGKEG